MRFLLVSQIESIAPRAFYFIPISLGYISSVLKAKGHEVEILEMGREREPIEAVLGARLKSAEYDAVCVGGLAGCFKGMKRVVDAAKAGAPGARTIAGGGLVTAEPRIMLEALGADIGVIGEGEETVVELAAALESGGDPRGVKGIIFTDAAGRTVTTDPRPVIDDIDSIPFPDYDALEAETYFDYQKPGDYYMYPFDHPRMLPLLTGRACPFRCTFCSNPLGNRYRPRSLGNVFEELDMLVSRYNINMLSIYDDVLSHRRERTLEFCERIKPYNLKWWAHFRVDSVDEELLATLKEAGMYSVSYGLDSASEPVLRSMKKNVKVEQMECALAATRKLGIGIIGNFIFGDPAETRETAKTTIAWWKTHCYHTVSLAPISPYPGSELYGRCVENGLIADRARYIMDECPAIKMTAMSYGELESVFLEAMDYVHRNFHAGEIVSARACEPGEPGREPTYSITARCPHCGAENCYDNYGVSCIVYTTAGLGLKISCRNCNQRYFVPLRGMIEKSCDAETGRLLTDYESRMLKGMIHTYLMMGHPRLALKLQLEHIKKHGGAGDMKGFFSNVLLWRKRRSELRKKGILKIFVSV